VAQYEIATLETALAFLAGRYRPTRDLCVLTFDDGLKEHLTEVLPILQQHQIQGLFFVSTGCLEQRVASVHKNHFLMASLGLVRYREAFLEQLAATSPATSAAVDPGRAQAYYRFDSPEVAAFKYLIAVGISNELRTVILDRLFARFLGDEKPFAQELYLTWDETRDLQRAGMVIGGHSHMHSVLRGLDGSAQRKDIGACAAALHSQLAPQPVWPFSYPYGEYDSVTVDALRELGFGCAFATEVGMNGVHGDPFRLRRIDTNDVAHVEPSVACTH
jgi:peptidoglycan/xylan/chitin deacetylase (PgdA/CDA1 family)